ncbi:hypothetical protein P7K49_021192 [Saguinus oedipus]|uniref:Uncharacterized protein n=1 Tax=Saguinus oedipus TaxID=9490 RepID=A0ABQ9URZ9_SAGOE|nr:hypothetical protein P7K49_021192 [Saguinus oedipus]
MAAEVCALLLRAPGQAFGIWPSAVQRTHWKEMAEAAGAAQLVGGGWGRVSALLGLGGSTALRTPPGTAGTKEGPPEPKPQKSLRLGPGESAGRKAQAGRRLPPGRASEQCLVPATALLHLIFITIPRPARLWVRFPGLQGRSRGLQREITLSENRVGRNAPFGPQLSEVSDKPG